MELRLLEYFLTVVREENISRAAEVLHVTQPTLSRQMKELEDELHTTLFIRGIVSAAMCAPHGAHTRQSSLSMDEAHFTDH